MFFPYGFTGVSGEQWEQSVWPGCSLRSQSLLSAVFMCLTVYVLLPQNKYNSVI